MQVDKISFNPLSSACPGPHPRKWPGIYFLMRASSKRAEQEMSLMVLLAIALTYRVTEKM